MDGICILIILENAYLVLIYCLFIVTIRLQTYERFLSIW